MEHLPHKVELRMLGREPEPVARFKYFHQAEVWVDLLNAYLDEDGSINYIIVSEEV